jgi:hypothetical protein
MSIDPTTNEFDVKEGVMTQECGSPHLQLGSSLSIEFAILFGYDGYPIEITNTSDFMLF